MNHTKGDIRDLLKGKKFVNGEWVSAVEVKDSELERNEEICSECHEPLTEENMWSEMTCVDCARSLGLDDRLAVREDVEEALAEISEETEGEDVKDEREVQVDVGLELETTPPPSSPSDTDPMPEWWASAIENLDVLVDTESVESEEFAPEMSFALYRTTLDQFVKVFERLKLEEVKLRMSEENGLRTKEVDASHVMMTEVEIGEGAFSWMESKTDTTEMEIGLDIARLRQSLDALMSGELMLSLEDRVRGIRVTQRGDVETSHRLSPTDISGWSDPQRPKLNHELEFLVELDTKVLNYIIKFLKDADYVAFEWDPEEEGKLSIVKVINEMDDEIRAKVDGTAVRFPSEKVRSLYPTDYLMQIFRVCKDIKARVVSILMASDYPLEIQMNGERVRFNALLAPRIESEDS